MPLLVNQGVVSFPAVVLPPSNRALRATTGIVAWKTGVSAVAIKLPDEDAAMDWVDANQLGRRNLTSDQASVLRGRIYNRRKKAVGKPAGTKLGQHEPISTAEQVAKETGVSARTIKRDGKDPRQSRGHVQ